MKHFAGLLIITIVGVGLLLGPDNVFAWGRTIGAALNPTAVVTYGGSERAPERVSAPDINGHKAVIINGWIAVDVLPMSKLCYYWEDGEVKADKRHEPQQMRFAPLAGPASITVLSWPYDQDCPSENNTVLTAL